MQRGSFQWMKSMNKSIILNKIRKDGPISRAQIAKETELTPPTVGNIVKELIEEQLIIEGKQGTSQGGRKPTMLVVNTSGFYIIGVDVGPKEIDFIISDLSGKIVDHAKTEIIADIDEKQFITMLQDGIQSLLEHFSELEVIGIGIAMHGVVDAEAGQSLFAPNLNLRNIPIKQLLEENFQVVVKVENDARSLALGEAWFGKHDAVKSMIAVNIGRGIGAGIIIDGKLYHGENGIAGEIGHMTLDIHGEKCECGSTGCLQTVASGPSLVNKAKQRLAQGEESILDPSSLTGSTIHVAAINGDVLSSQLFIETGTYIGIALTNLIHMFNPSKIVISGGVSKAGGFILDPIKETVSERAITEQAQQTQIVISELGEYGSALGAIALILQDLFEPV